MRAVPMIFRSRTPNSNSTTAAADRRSPTIVPDSTSASEDALSGPRRAWHLARMCPPVSPTDPVSVVVDAFHRHKVTVLPVMESGGISGYVTRADLVHACGGLERWCEQGASSGMPLGAGAVRPFQAIVTGDATTAEIARLLDKTGEPAALVVGPDSQVLGLVQESQLLEPSTARVRLPMVGGMATPFGVYLGCEGLGGGVGFWALVSAGAFMAVLFTVADYLSELILGRLAGINPGPGLAGWWSSLPAAITGTAGAIYGGGALESALALLFFLLMIRFSPVAGYHAAEHQTVHTLEADESLTTERIRVKPRVHPRCGTNIMVTILLASLLLSVVTALQRSYPSASSTALEIGVVIIFIFRLSIGAAVQQHFTTRRASEAQIASGIRAANQLIARYSQAGMSPPGFWRRIWAMGLVQVGVGLAVVSIILSGAQWLMEYLSPVLSSPHLAWLGLAR